MSSYTIPAFYTISSSLSNGTKPQNVQMLSLKSYLAVEIQTSCDEGRREWTSRISTHHQCNASWSLKLHAFQKMDFLSNAY